MTNPSSFRPNWSEPDRLAALERYGILDTPREPAFDDLARLAAEIFETPIAVVNLIAEGRQWFKAEVGIGASELPLDVSICAHAILVADMLIVPDLREDDRFRCNPLVTAAESPLRFYAGALLKTDEGLPIGTLCVLDTRPRPEGATDRQRLTLEVLARTVMTQLELRRVLAVRETEVAARTAERNRLWELSGDLFAIMGFDGLLKAINPAWETILGRDAETLMSLSFREQVHPDDHAAVEKLIERLLRGETVKQFEDRLLHADGSWRWISWTLSPGGDVFYAVGRDVTEEKARAAALRLNAYIVQSDPSPVCAFDADYRLIGFNQAHNDEFRRVNGFDTKIGDVFPDLFIPEQRPVMRALMARALSGEHFTVVEEFGRPELGRPYWEISYTPLLDETGRIVGAFHRAKDVSARLRAEAELATAQEQLRQAQKLEAVGQLTGGVAHDFNNLLTVIRGSVELLMRPDVPEQKQRRYLKAIAETTERATRLTGQLLAFARRQALKPEVFDVGASVSALSDMLRTLCGSRVTLEIEPPEAPCFIDADPSQFDTALINMAVNARDAMEGEGRLRIEIRPVSEAPAIRGSAPVRRDFVAVSLSDTGSGISPEAAERIFEPFFTTKPVGQGTGLGLSQVFGFAQQSDGDIDLRSEVGQGATFTLYLPRAATPQAVVVPSAPDASVEGQGACVLVVEDNPDVGAFATQALAELGYLTILAADAPSALAELDRNSDRFHVVFSDVVMPGMDGVELAQEIRRRHPRLPVLLTSGYSHVLARSGTHGFELLHKPYSIEQLSRMLRKAARPSQHDKRQSSGG